MFNFSTWMTLPITVRHKIAAAFGIEKVRPTHVFNNEIADDGYALKDIEKNLTLERLQAFLDTSENDLMVLWGMLLEKMEDKPVEVTPEITPEVTASEPVAEVSNVTTTVVSEPVNQPTVNKPTKNGKKSK